MSKRLLNFKILTPKNTPDNKKWSLLYNTLKPAMGSVFVTKKASSKFFEESKGLEQELGLLWALNTQLWMMVDNQILAFIAHISFDAKTNETIINIREDKGVVRQIPENSINLELDQNDKNPLESYKAFIKEFDENPIYYTSKPSPDNGRGRSNDRNSSNGKKGSGKAAKENITWDENLLPLRDALASYEYYNKISNELDFNFNMRFNYSGQKFIAIEKTAAPETFPVDRVVKNYSLVKYSRDMESKLVSQGREIMVVYMVTGTPRLNRREEEDLQKGFHSLKGREAYLSPRKPNETNITRGKKTMIHVASKGEFYDGGKIDITLYLIDEPRGSDQHVNSFNYGTFALSETIKETLRDIRSKDIKTLSLVNKLLTGENLKPISKFVSDAKGYTKNLNSSQIDAFMKATAHDAEISVIHGPPGTGKTQVISALIKYFWDKKKTTLISSNTNVAIDNVFERMLSDGSQIIPQRVMSTFAANKSEYSKENIPNFIYNDLIGTRLIKLMESGDESYKKIYEDYKSFESNVVVEEEFLIDTQALKVFGATTTTSAFRNFKRKINVLIIDEVSKCSIPEVLKYCLIADRVVLVGDNRQLPPLLEFTKRDSKHLDFYDEEKFERMQANFTNSIFDVVYQNASKVGNVTFLNENYRSVPAILDTYSIFYDDLDGLKSSKVITDDTLIKFNPNKYFSSTIPLYFFSLIGSEESTKTHSRQNITEQEAIGDALATFLDNAESLVGKSMSIIFPYALQLSEFKKKYSNVISQARKIFGWKNFKIDTIDSFQGSESDIIFVSTVITRTDNMNFMTNYKRTNVALSRARVLLAVFGDSNALSSLVDENTGKRYMKEILEEIVVKDKVGGAKVIEYKANNEKV